jgi:hypothetical protein
VAFDLVPERVLRLPAKALAIRVEPHEQLFLRPLGDLGVLGLVARVRLEIFRDVVG